MKRTLLVALCLCLMLTACSSGALVEQHIEVEGVLAILDGYTFVAASAYGAATNKVTLYCEHNETGQVFECTNGQIGNQIVIPDGYTFVAASAYGQFRNKVTFYCQYNETGQIHVCN